MADPVEELRNAGSTLGDIVNWSRRNLPPIPGLNLDPLGSLGLNIADLTRLAGAPQTADDIKRTSDIVSGQMAQTGTDIISAPTGLYSLANAGVNAVRPKTFDEIIAGSKDYGKPQLPGAQGAIEFTQDVSTLGSAMGERIAGEKVDLGILGPIKQAETDPLGGVAQLTGSLARIAGGILPAPEGAVAAIANLGAKMETGIKVVDSIVKGTGKSLEFLTPITFTPTKVGYATNAVVGTGLTAGLEAILNDEPKVEQAVAQTNSETVAAFKGTEDIKNRKLVQAGMLPFTDWQDNAAVGAAIGGATVAALLLRKGLKGTSEALGTPTALDAMISDRLAPLRGSLAAIDPQTAKHFDNFSSRHSVDGSISTAVEHWVDTGRLPDAQVSQLGPVKPLSVTPQREVLERVNALGPKRDGFNRLLSLETELDNRIDNLINMKKSDGTHPYASLDKYLKYKNPTTGDWDYDYNRLRNLIPNLRGGNVDEAISVNMTGNQTGQRLSTIDLFNEIEALKRDPQLLALRNLFHNDYRTTTKYIENLGLRSKSEAEDFRKANINYSPTERDYGTNLWQRTKDANSGVDDMGDPVAQRAEYFQTVISQAMKDQTKQYWMQRMWDARNQGSKYAKELITRRATEIDSFVDAQGKIKVRYKDGKTNEYNANDVVVWRDDKGKQHVDEISDPLVRAALKQESPYAVHQAMYIMDKARRFTQVIQTGLATTTNTLFAPLSAIQTVGFGAVKLPKDVVGGPLDRLVRYATNDKLRVPGDITAILDAPQAIIADALSEISRRLYHGFESSSINNGPLARMLGPGHTQLLSDTFKGFWEDSIRYAMHDLGVSHSAPLTDTSTYYNWMRNTGQQKSMLGATGQALKEVYRVVDQAHNIVSASPISAMVRNNIDRLTPDRLTKVAREYAADPGKRALAPSAFESPIGKGLSSALHIVNASFPYANVTIQSIADFMREAKKRPIDMAMGVTIGVGIPAMLATSYNVGLGPEYTDYQFNQRPASKQAQNLYFGIKGLPPEHGIEYPIDPFYRPFQVLASTLIGGTFGLYDGSIFKPSNDHVKMRMQEAAMPRFRQTIEEALTMSFGVQMPLAAEMLVVASGNIPGEISPFKSPIRKPSEHRLGGFDNERTSRYVDDNLFGVQIDRRFDELNRVVFGQLGEQVLGSLRTLSRTADAGAPISEGFQDIGEREVMRLKDGAKMFNGLLWTQSPKLSPYGVESTLLFDKRTGMRKLTEAYNEIQRAGMSGSKSRPGAPLQGAQQAMPVDTQILEIAQQASMLNRQLDKAFLSPLKALQDQVVSIESSVRFRPQTQRKLLNDLNAKIQDFQAGALSQIELFERLTSQRLGRKVRLDKINLERGVDQFAPLAPP